MRLLTFVLTPLALFLFVILAQPEPALSLDTPPIASSNPDTTLAADIAYGAELFARNCQRCHNLRGPAERTDRGWVMIMQHMQSRAGLTHEQVHAVRSFLLASNDAAQAPGRLRPELAATTVSDPTPEMIAVGRTLYAGAGTCFACHGATLTGTAVAPSLADANWKSGDGSYASILTVVRNGLAGTAMTAYPAGITDEQAQAVSAYVWAVAQGSTEP